MKQAFRNGIAAAAHCRDCLNGDGTGCRHRACRRRCCDSGFHSPRGKPPAGPGQLDCQGLNRALALPAVVERMFGKPDAIFAPDPSGKNDDGGIAFDYVRPLATIEPTAIAFGLPVNASIRFPQRRALNAALEKALNSGPREVRPRRLGAQGHRAGGEGAACGARRRSGRGARLERRRLRQHVRRHHCREWWHGKFRHSA